jgi:hypothetical protein
MNEDEEAAYDDGGVVMHHPALQPPPGSRQEVVGISNNVQEPVNHILLQPGAAGGADIGHRADGSHDAVDDVAVEPIP